MCAYHGYCFALMLTGSRWSQTKRDISVKQLLSVKYSNFGALLQTSAFLGCCFGHGYAMRFDLKMHTPDLAYILLSTSTLRSLARLPSFHLCHSGLQSHPGNWKTTIHFVKLRERTSEVDRPLSIVWSYAKRTGARSGYDATCFGRGYKDIYSPVT